MQWNEFIAIPNGTRVLNHSYDQCVALANLYHEQVIGGAFVPVGSAYQWSTQFTGYPQLFNTYNQLPASADPQPGDIFVCKGGIYNAIDGHIGVVVRAWDGSTFGTKEQNAEKNRYVYQTYNRTKANMLSYLRPKVNPTGDEEMTPEQNNALMSVYAATFFGGGDAGTKSIIQRLVDIETEIGKGESIGTGSTSCNCEITVEVIRDIVRGEIDKTRLTA